MSLELNKAEIILKKIKIFYSLKLQFKKSLLHSLVNIKGFAVYLYIYISLM